MLEKHCRSQVVRKCKNGPPESFLATSEIVIDKRIPGTTVDVTVCISKMELHLDNRTKLSLFHLHHLVEASTYRQAV